MKRIIVLAIAMLATLVSLNGCFVGYPVHDRGGYDRDRGHDHDRGRGYYYERDRDHDWDGDHDERR